MQASTLKESDVKELLKDIAADIIFYNEANECDIVNGFSTYNDNALLIKIDFHEKLVSNSIIFKIEPICRLINASIEGALMVLFDDRILVKSVNIAGFARVVRFSPPGERNKVPMYLW